MIKITFKLDVSLSKIVLGFAGMSAAVGAFYYFYTKNNKQIGLKTVKTVTCDTNDINDIKNTLESVSDPNTSDTKNMSCSPKSLNSQACEEVQLAVNRSHKNSNNSEGLFLNQEEENC